MIEWLTFFSTVATLVLAGVAVAALRVSMQQTRESQRQFLENQRQTQESLEASQRPFLHPVGNLKVAVNDDGSRYFEFEHLDNYAAQTITLKNGGVGIAFNVRGVLMHARIESDLGIRPGVRSFVLSDPLPVSDTTEWMTTAGPNSFDWDTTVDNNPEHTLAAPAKAIARLTVTYQDISGHTLASQFDCVPYRATEVLWEFRWFLTKDVRGIADIQSEVYEQQQRSHTAFQAQLGTTQRR